MNALMMCLAIGVSVKDFGAIGDGVVDDTIAIQAAADSCKLSLKAIQPTGGSYQGTCPELFFPSGKYRVSNAISLNAYQAIRGEDAILIQANAASQILSFSSGYQNRITAMQFVGGTRQISFSNANVDGSFLTIRDCQFQGWSDWSVFAEGTVDDLHLSTTLKMERCRWDGGQAVYTHCDATRISDSEAIFRGSSIQNESGWVCNAGFARTGGRYSYGGVLSLSNITFVPASPVVPTSASPKSVNAYWIKNCGSVVCERVRFGGEGAGVPILIHCAPLNLVNPWSGSKVTFDACQLSCGQDADSHSAVVTVKGGFPQCLRLTACDGVVSNTIPIVKVADNYNMDADVAAITSNAATSVSMYTITMQGNQFYVPKAIPASLQKFVK